MRGVAGCVLCCLRSFLFDLAKSKLPCWQKAPLPLDINGKFNGQKYECLMAALDEMVAQIKKSTLSIRSAGHRAVLVPTIMDAVWASQTLRAQCFAADGSVCRLYGLRQGEDVTSPFILEGAMSVVGSVMRSWRQRLVAASASSYGESVATVC